jgi:hypothetical protein
MLVRQQLLKQRRQREQLWQLVQPWIWQQTWKNFVMPSLRLEQF